MNVPKLDARQGAALALLDALATGRAAPELRGELRWTAELSALGMQRLSIHIHRYLLKSGLAERTVLRNGRTRGRFLDPELNEELQLRYTIASLELWRGLYHLHTKGQEIDIERAKRLIKRRDTGTGDWLFYALAAQHLQALGMGAAQGALLTALAQRSPLAALFLLVDPTSGAESALDATLSQLTSKGAIRLLELLEGPLLAAWTRALTRAAQTSPRSAVEAWGARFSELSRVLERFRAALDRARRLDLARPLLSLLSRASETIFKGPPEALPEALLAGARPKRIAERTQALAEVARVCALAQTFCADHQRFIEEGYGGERYEEGQLFIRDFEALLRPQVERLGAQERALRGVIR